LIGKASDAHLLSGAALVFPSLAMIAPLGIAPLLGILAIGHLIIAPRRPAVLAPPLLALTVLLAAMALLGALSTLWSIIPAHSLFEALRLALLAAAGLIATAAALTLDEAGRARVGRASVAGFVLGVLVLAVEFFGDFPIRRALSSVARVVIALSVLDRGAIMLTLACWAPILYLVERRRAKLAALIFLAALIAVDRLISLSAVCGLVAAAFAFALGWWRPRLTAALLAVGFAVLTVVLPFCAPTREAVLWLSKTAPWLRTSAHHRLVIWRFTSDRIAEKPLLGWGMDASRAMPGGQTSVRDYMRLPESLPLDGAVMPLHPHDAILQWVVELGVAGGMLGAAIVIYAAWLAGFAGTAPRAARATGLAVITAALPPLLLSFGVWQAWWHSALWLTAALIVAVASAPQPASVAPLRR
jgi:exopolysaccharide production protein ExoQ